MNLDSIPQRSPFPKVGVPLINALPCPCLAPPFREGRLRELDHVVSQCPREQMLMWFSVRMFQEACLHNRLQTVRGADQTTVLDERAWPSPSTRVG